MSEAPLPGEHGEADEMCSYAVDVWLKDTALLTDDAGLMALMRDAAEAGHAQVLGESVHRFPNGAVTGVLVLSQSHLSVHTWPEYQSANFDLLTCGRLNGERIIEHLRTALDITRINITRVLRDVQ
ncbi:adenosylmethionine decarboxylase [Longispora sp. NPDC051575]|uniref:adenosylmethionine decarboxylase n=1 Tax=Longispora sp. NPDC051575 TaxID=3154943 RepID=UPI0034481106